MRSSEELLKRLGTLAAGSALVTLSYYVWLIGGYLNPPYMVAQWTMMLAGGLLLCYSLTTGRFRTPALFEGKRGLATASLILAFGVYVTYVQGFSQPGFLLVEGFVFIFSAFTYLNALAPGVLARPDVARLSATAGFVTISGVFALFSLRFGVAAPVFYIAAALTGAVSLRLRRLERFLPFALLSEVALFGYLLSLTMPAYATDEFAIDAYAARLFLHGLNPYSQASLGHALSYYGLSPYYETPLSQGGYVDWLSYPSLSFVALAPFVATGVQSRTVLVALTFGSLVLVYTRFRKAGPVSLVALLVILVDASVLYFPAGSVPDILWAFPLALSLVLRKRTAVSGALYGVSLSAKQIPAVILPFLAYFVYREGGRKTLARFSASAFLTFFAINAPFALSSPVTWARDLLSPLGAPLVGAGQGLSEVSFLGYAALPRSYFVFLEVLSAAVLFALYVKGFERYRYSFLGFPVLIFFFGYRFLFNYVVYWPLLAVLALPAVTERAPERVTKKRRNRALQVEAGALIVFVLAGWGAGALLHVGPELRIYSVGGFADPLGMPGFVTSMTVNATYTNGTNFRIFDSDTMNSVNGLVWMVVNATGKGDWRLYTIEPLTPSLALPAGARFELEAYTGVYHTYYAVANAPEPRLGPIANPSLYSYGGSVPGWSFVADTQGGRAGETVLAEGVTLWALKKGSGWAAAELSQGINISRLLGYTLRYSLAGVSSGSLVALDGNPATAVGLEFASAGYEVWCLYSQTERGVYRPNGDTLVYVSNTTAVSLESVYYELLGLGWTPASRLYLILVAGIQTGYGSVSATFLNLTLAS